LIKKLVILNLKFSYIWCNVWLYVVTMIERSKSFRLSCQHMFECANFSCIIDRSCFPFRNDNDIRYDILDSVFNYANVLHYKKKQFFHEIMDTYLYDNSNTSKNKSHSRMYQRWDEILTRLSEILTLSLMNFNLVSSRTKNFDLSIGIFAFQWICDW